MPEKGLGNEAFSHPQHPPKMLKAMTSACRSAVPPPKSIPDARVKPKSREMLLGGDLFTGQVQGHPSDHGGRREALLRFNHTPGHVFLQSFSYFPSPKGVERGLQSFPCQNEGWAGAWWPLG